jgi:ketopantoate reductase
VLLKSFHKGAAPIEVEACALADVAEGIAVAGALGVKHSSRDREAWVKASAGLPAEFKTSMLQNLEKGSPTEIDFINGRSCAGASSAASPPRSTGRSWPA